MKNFFQILIIFFINYLFSNCNNINNKNSNTIVNSNEQKIYTETNKLKIEINPSGKLKIGDTISISLNINDSISTDSIQLFINNNPYKTFQKTFTNYKLSTKGLKAGRNKIKLIAKNNNKTFNDEVNLTLLSDIVPQTKKYKIIKTFPHDKQAYTQGLLFYKGYLYESTGLKTHSSLRKVKFETGEILQTYNLQSDIFGEGITLYKDKIIQLSYQSKVGFVYNIDDFSLIQNFSYSTEGWGITTVENQIVMSDGTSNLYFLDPVTFNETSRQEVYDNNGPVVNLNEMEYIEGYIYANIYQTDKIAIIEPQTGRVLYYINCEGLLQEKDNIADIDVLNGIAYDKETKRIFVTGKKWPKLFEIKIY